MVIIVTAPRVNHKHDGLQHPITSVYCRTNVATKMIYYQQLYLYDVLSPLIATFFIIFKIFMWDIPTVFAAYFHTFHDETLFKSWLSDWLVWIVLVPVLVENWEILKQKWVKEAWNIPQPPPLSCRSPIICVLGHCTVSSLLVLLDLLKLLWFVHCKMIKYELYLILFVADRRRKLRGRSPLQDETPDENDYIDEAMKHSDALAMERITATMEDYESDMNNYSGPVGKGDRSRSG